MLERMNRRSFLRWARRQARRPWLRAGCGRKPRRRQPAARADDQAATTPIKTTKLYDNLYLLQGAGGNMALQTGADGNLLIDASFAPAVPRIREAIAALAPQATRPAFSSTPTGTATTPAATKACTPPDSPSSRIARPASGSPRRRP